MAQKTKWATAKNLTPGLDVGVFAIRQKIAVAAADAVAANDTILLYTFQKGGVIYKADLKTSASLGAGATAQLRTLGSSAQDVTAATAAGAASKVNGGAAGPVEFEAGDTLEILVAGGAIAAPADVSVHLLIQYD